MKRVRAAMAMAMATLSVSVVAGCGFATYESRMEKSLAEMREEQKLKTYTEEPAQGKFKELSVFVRPPKPLAEDALQLGQSPGMFDHGATFSGAPKGVAAKEGETAPILPPLKLHVLVRTKAKKAAPKKGEAPPPADPNAAAVAARGSFLADVKAVLAAEFGAEAASETPPKAVNARNNAFKRLIFTAGNGDTIQVYFAEANKGELETALIFDIPPALLKNPIVTSGVDLTLKSFALGPKALGAFNGNASGGTGGGGGAAAGGPAF